MKEIDEIDILNKFLGGIHMGIDTFKEYEKKAKNEDLRIVLRRILIEYKKDEKVITDKILELKGTPIKRTLGINEFITLITRIKELPINTDSEILESSIEACTVGRTLANEYLEHNNKLNLINNDLFKGLINKFSIYITELQNIKL